LDESSLGCFFMYLLYLDDAGSPGNAVEEYFVLGGICVYEAQVDWFSREIDKLATPYDKNPEDVEFHASTIFSRRADPWKNLTIDEARGVLKSVLNVVAVSYDTARLFACAIHKKSFPNQDPVELAFEDLCQRFDYFLMRRRQQGDQQRGLLVLDKTTRETSLQKLSREFRKAGTRWGSLKNMADTPFLWTPALQDSCRLPITSHILFFDGIIRAMPSILTSLHRASTRPTASSMDSFTSTAIV
jgi:hypothetical protein